MKKNEKDDSETSRLLGGQNASRHVQLETDSVPDVVTYGSATDEHTEQVVSDTETPAEEEGFSCRRASKRQILSFICVASLNFSGYCYYSVIAPFFPDEAIKRGASQTVVGLIFGCFAVVNFLGGLVFGKYLTAIGSRFMLTSGVFVGGSCSVLFGLLEYTEGTTFIVFCFAIRSIEALGVAGFQTAGTAILTHAFPNNVATVMGSLEIFTGLGLMAGPPIGGVLYDLGGFKTPFMTMGGLLLCCCVFVTVLIPPQPDEQEGKTDVPLLSFFKIPAFLIACGLAIMVACMLDYIDPVLQPYLIKEFKTSPVRIGLMYLLWAAIYSVLAPAWGRLADKKKWVPIMVPLGMLVTSVGTLILGPSPLLTDYVHILPKTEWVNTVGLAVIAVSVGASLTPIVNIMLWAASDAGMESNFALYGVVSGVMNAFFAIGDLVGPLGSSALSQRFGFPWASTAFGGLVLFYVCNLSRYRNKMLIVVVFYSYNGCLKTRRSLHNSIMEVKKDDCETSRLLDGQNGSRHVQLKIDSVPDVITYGSLTDEHTEQVVSDSDTETPKKEEGFSCGNASKRQILSFICVAFLNFAGMSCQAIIAPFFPNEALRRGASQTTVGFVFGCFSGVQFLGGLVFGKFITTVGSRFVLISGVFVAGSCSLLFGFLEYMEGATFIAFCFAIRTMEALGVSAQITAATTILTHEFPNNVAKVMGILEIFTGLGMMTGPPIGGVLYNLGGFKLPFFTVGGMMLCCCAVLAVLVPTQVDEQEEGKVVSLLSLLKIPTVIMACGVTVVLFCTVQYLYPVFQPYVTKEFNVTPAQVGLYFLLFASVYAVCAPVWGWLADKKKYVRIMMILGLLVLSAGALLIGPSPLLTDYLTLLPKTMWMNIIGMVVLALSVGLVSAPLFNVMLWAASDAGMEIDFATYGLVSGIFGAFMSMGTFIGPTVSSALVEKFGLPWASTAFSGFILFSMLLVLTFTICESVCKRCRAGPLTEEEVQGLVLTSP
ncbi:SLC18B1 [Branchiostoma lanceolatum]|uniref:SLC18B1 protein n=1 Tax=Branchiostoma lanceolatum TaxID=7740 RepID=A0A8K0ESX2_BRALA|nr:SLC18B1 [Branchiostoma lanceolatum]